VSEEKEAAEKYCKDVVSCCGEEGCSFCGSDSKAFLAGIEWERKRLADKMNGPYGLGPREPTTHAEQGRWQDSIQEVCRKLAKRRHDEQEGLVAEYLVAHPDAKIEDIELVEVHEDCTYRWFVKRRGALP
jgi:hypothetical protein